MTIHYKISLTLATTERQRKRVKRYNFQKIRQLLLQEPLIEKVQGDVHTDYVWKAWDSHFQDIVQRSSYWVTAPNCKKPWYNVKLHRMRRCQDRLYHLYVRSPSTTNWVSCSICRNTYRKKVRETRTQFLSCQGRNLGNQCRVGDYVWWKRAKRLFLENTRLYLN